MSLTNTSSKRKKWVFEQFQEWKKKNPKASKGERSKKMKSLWNEAKAKIK